MKLLVLLLPIFTWGQSVYSSEFTDKKVKLNVQIDNSFKYYQPSGFSGIGVHAGIWIKDFGFTLGGADTKKNKLVNARRDLMVSVMQKFELNDFQFIPFYSVGTNKYFDLGLRIGYKVYEGIYIGGMSSLNLKYGLTISITTK